MFTPMTREERKKLPKLQQLKYVWDAVLDFPDWLRRTQEAERNPKWIEYPKPPVDETRGDGAFIRFIDAEYHAPNKPSTARFVVASEDGSICPTRTLELTHAQVLNLGAGFEKKGITAHQCAKALSGIRDSEWAYWDGKRQKPDYAHPIY